MFHTVIQGAYECFKMWKVVSQTNSNWDQPPKDLLDEMNSQPAHLQWIKNICLIFYNQRYKCKKCSHQTGCNFSDHTPLRDQEKHDLDSSTTTQNNRLPLPDPLPLDIGVVENASTPEPTYNHLSINFDDYGSAPLNRQQAPLVSNTWTFDSTGLLLLPNWASSWKDQGYKLPPYFDWISSIKTPTDYLS